MRSRSFSFLLVPILCFLLATNVLAATDFSTSDVSAHDSALLEPKRLGARHYIEGTSLTEDTLALAKMLTINQTLDDLSKLAKEPESKPNQENLVQVMLLRQNCERKIQFASLELEEALANIDGDLAYTQLEYSLFADKRDRSIALNNAATFLTSGTLGILDSATGIKYAAPIPNVFGITGNAAAVAFPLWGLRSPKYKSIQNGSVGNMLAPLFDLPYQGSGYDPIIWKYLNTVALDEKDNITRRQALLNRWKKFRNLSKEGTKNEKYIKQLSGLLEPGEKVSLDLLKTRTELLVELRAEVQSLYADLSDLNTEIMKY